MQFLPVGFLPPSINTAVTKNKQTKKGGWGNPVLSALFCIWFAQDSAFVENVARKVKAREEKAWTAALK